MRSPRLYVYKCVVDNGTAPCVDDGLLTLTICKPFIRSTAPKHSLIFAFGANDETPANRLVYIAQVSTRVERGAYFEIAKGVRIIPRSPDSKGMHLALRRIAL